MSQDLIIIGASGHGKVVADIARQMMFEGRPCYSSICFLDDDISKRVCGHYPVVGTTREMEKYYTAEMFIAIGNANTRKQLAERIDALGIRMPILIHPYAIVAEDVSLGRGSVIVGGAVVNPNTVIGKHCIINTGATVDHDCVIEDYVHIAPGTHMCGDVRIGCGSWLGAGSTVVQGVQICEGCMIGAGAVVINDIKEAGTYMGVPAKRRAG